MTNVDAICELHPDGDRAALHFERLYDFTPDELWAALTDPDRIQGWLARATRFELQVGGAVRLDFGETEDERAVGSITALEAGRVLEYSWSAAGYGAGWEAHLETLAGERQLGAWDERYLELRPRYAELVSALP